MESGSTEWCAMELAKDNFAHNIPKDWITAKVWEVICKNPVYKDYVKENARYVNKLLHKNVEKTIDKPSEINYINNTNETTTKNSKGDKTMKLNNAEISANIEQLTNKVNELLERIAVLEGRKTETHNFKKLRERKDAPSPSTKDEAPKTETKKVEAPKKKTAVTNEKQELMKLQKKARESEKTLTKKQMGEYTKLITEQCREINKTIAKTDKSARSMAFVKARISCLKKARAI
jgi:hypothetical protein